MSPSLKLLMGTSLDRIHAIASTHRAPAILSSWSKDSMVMWSLVRAAGYHWPVITFMTEWTPRKWTFAREMSARFDEPIITYNPRDTWVYEQDGGIVLGSEYQFGPDPAGPGIDIHTDVIEPEGDSLPPGTGCGMEYMHRLRGATEWRWDAVLIGHRDVDRDRFLGALPLAAARVEMPGETPDLWFPLKEWSDRDIWDYTRAESVPVDWRRYSHEARWDVPGWVPASLLNESNNDCLHACVRCLRRDSAGQRVHCPALGEEIDSRAGEVTRRATLALDYFTPAPKP